MLDPSASPLEFPDHRPDPESLVTTALRAVADEAELLSCSRVGFFWVRDPRADAPPGPVWSSRVLAGLDPDRGGLSPWGLEGLLADCVETAAPLLDNDFRSGQGSRYFPGGRPDLARVLAVPVLRGGRVVAVLGVGNRPWAYLEEDARRLAGFADRAWSQVEGRRAAGDRQASGRVVPLHRPAPAVAPAPEARDPRLQALFSAGPGALLVVDKATGAIRDANPAAEAFYGWERRDLTRLTLADLQDPTAGAGIERHRRADGGCLEVSLVAWDGAEHGTDGRVLLVRDAAGRRAAEQDLLRMRAELDHLRRLESLGRLAGGVTHDMNNVLGAIMAVASLLQVRHGELPAVVKDADLILQAAGRGRDLVRSLRDFSRREPQPPRDLDLNALVREEAELLRRTTLVRQGVDLELDLDPDLRPVHGEAGALANALMNLCLNACDAMPGGGRLVLATRRLEAGGCTLAVQDDGEGMGPEVLARALEPFFTTKPLGKGTGLGLSLVQETLQAHGGSMEVQSTPGGGTRVTLRFPPGASEPRTVPAPATAAPSGGLRVLLVDDEELIRLMTGQLLECLGHETEAVAGGVEALARLEAEPVPDLVVLDLNMPGLDGLSTLQRLRIRHPRLPVVVSTGFITAGARAALGSLGPVRVLDKPYTLADLEASLTGWN